MSRKKRLFHVMDRFTSGSEMHGTLIQEYDDLTTKAIMCERMCHLVRGAFEIGIHRWHDMSPDRVAETVMVGLLRANDMRAFRMLNKVNLISKSVMDNPDIITLNMIGGGIIGSVKLLLTPDDNYLHVVYDMREGHMDEDPFRSVYMVHLDDVLHGKPSAFDGVPL